MDFFRLATNNFRKGLDLSHCGCTSRTASQAHVRPPRKLSHAKLKFCTSCGRLSSCRWANSVGVRSPTIRAAAARCSRSATPRCNNGSLLTCTQYFDEHGCAYTPIWESLVHLLTSNRSKLSTIRSAALPSHFGGIAPFFQCPTINRACAGGSLLGSVPMSSFVPIVMVSGRSVLSRSARTGWLFWFVWFIWFVLFI